MAREPDKKYAMAFFDGQNLYQHAKAAFGHHHPNYDPKKLHEAVCRRQGWHPNLVRFYTGVPDPKESPTWAGYWNNRAIAMKRAGITVVTRRIRYRRELVRVGEIEKVHTTPQEKGIDVRLALDIVVCARRREFDVAVIYGQDQDLQEVVREVRGISIEQDRWIGWHRPFRQGHVLALDGGSTRRIGSDWTRNCMTPASIRATTVPSADPPPLDARLAGRYE